MIKDQCFRFRFNNTYSMSEERFVYFINLDNKYKFSLKFKTGKWNNHETYLLRCFKNWKSALIFSLYEIILLKVCTEAKFSQFDRKYIFTSLDWNYNGFKNWFLSCKNRNINTDKKQCCLISRRLHRKNLANIYFELFTLINFKVPHQSLTSL